MRWLVGIDLRERSSGAVQMAAWMRDRDEAREVPTQHFVGIHVVDDSVRHSMRVTSEVVHDASTRMEQIARGCGVANPFEALRVISAATTEEAIADLVATEGHEGVIVGRIAAAQGHPLRRLGRVARRLVRQLPAPVMVVPPYLPCEEIGRAPVLLASELGSTSAAAARCARRLARELGRDLVVLHVDAAFLVIPDPIGEGFTFAPTARRTVGEVEAWAREQELDPAECMLLDGAVPDAVIGQARQLDAPMIVCGSRRLSMAERIFASSTASDLARWSDRAVLVVPQDGPTR